MINISNPIDCCGCSACVERCPKHCISFGEYKEGFRYPKVDSSICIECGMCEKVCPVLHKKEPVEYIKVYAAKTCDEHIRYNSSSGGIFTVLAEQVILQGGVVFGARFDENWEVCHSFTENIEDLALFRESKYMQSRIGNSYLMTEKFLKDGRIVLFTGTPCQVAGLRGFLRREYENLITVDFICHGVPSPKVWRKYLQQLIREKKIGPSLKDVEKVDFRAKNHGWTNYGIQIFSRRGNIDEPHTDNPYNKAFNMNILLRPICFSCPFKGGSSGSDLTIADFWGISKVEPDMNDDKGTSMVIDYNKRSIPLGGNISIKEVSSEVVSRCNPSFYHSSQYNGNRVVMFGKLDNTDDVIGLMIRCTNPTTIQRIKNVIYRKTHK